MPKRREIYWAAGILAPLVVILFADRWLHGSSIYFSIVEEGFPISANYPWDRFAARCLADGRFPLWNPYQSCGNTFLANYLPAFFFFPRWIMYLNKGAIVRDFYVLMRFWLGGILFYVFLRRISLKIPGASLATVSFLVGGYFTRYYNENYLNIDLFLGLWLMAGEMLVRNKSLGSVIGLSLAILAVVLGGHPEAAFHALAILSLWIMYRSWIIYRRDWGVFKPVYLFIAAGVAAGIAAGAQLMPFLEALSQSANYHIPNLGRYHYDLKHFASLVYPWIYGEWPAQYALRSVPPISAGTSYIATTINWLPPYLGLIPIMFAGVAMFRLRKSHPAAVFFLVYLFITIGGVFAIPPFNWIYSIPPLQRLGNYKHLFPEITLSVTILAGMGLDSSLRARRNEVGAVMIPVMIALMALGGYAVLNGASGGISFVLLFGALPLSALMVAMIFKLDKPGRIVFSVVSVALCYVMGVVYTRGYHAQPLGYLRGMERAPFVQYVKEHLGDDRYASLYPPLLLGFGPAFEIADIRGHDALQPKPLWDLFMEVNGMSIQDATSYYHEIGGFAPLPETLGDERLEATRLRFIISPANLGGMIVSQAILHHADVEAASSDYFRWGVWNKGGDRRPVLYTHPPIKLEIDYELPVNNGQFEQAIGWHPDIIEGKRDGAFVVVREERSGESKTIYARYLSPEDTDWVNVPIRLFPEPGIRRTVIVSPMGNSNLDWFGWGIKNSADKFWGYQLAYPGLMVESEKFLKRYPLIAEWGTIQVYERTDLPPFFSLAEKPTSMATQDIFSARQIAPDEYVFNDVPYLPVLVGYGFNYRPGWRLFGEREVKIINAAPFTINATINTKNDSVKGPFKMVYIPWGFRLGIWLSISSAMSLAALLIYKKCDTASDLKNTT